MTHPRPFQGVTPVVRGQFGTNTAPGVVVVLARGNDDHAVGHAPIVGEIFRDAASGEHVRAGPWSPVVTWIARPFPDPVRVRPVAARPNVPHDPPPRDTGRERTPDTRSGGDPRETAREHGPRNGLGATPYGMTPRTPLERDQGRVQSGR